jgi:hypothetical protein
MAHLGIGSRLVSPWTRSLPRWAVLLGTVLPDLIDKPLYYLVLLVAPLRHVGLDFINNSRTVAHTGMFLLVLTGLAVLRRSRVLAALALGVASHLLLDNLADSLFDTFMPDPSLPPTHSALVALLWPFKQASFPRSPFHTFEGHMHRSFNPLSLGFEVVGLGILGWDLWQRRHESEILAALNERRLRRRRRRE